MPSDPVWNTPEPIDIYGRQFTVRELPAGKLRTYIREVVAIIGRAAAEQDATESGIQMIEEASDELWTLVSESADIPAAQLDELPGRVFMRLLDEVIKAQEPMVKDFLAVKVRVDALTAPFKKARQNGATARPSSSDYSSAPASASTTFSSD